MTPAALCRDRGVAALATSAARPARAVGLSRCAAALSVDIGAADLASLAPVQLAQLAELRRTGLFVYLADRGSDHPAPDALGSLPIDGIKLDLSAGDTERGAELAHAAVDLGLVVVAEAVQSAAALMRCERLGCTAFCGNHLAAPMTGPGCTTWLREQGWRRAQQELAGLTDPGG